MNFWTAPSNAVFADVFLRNSVGDYIYQETVPAQNVNEKKYTCPQYEIIWLDSDMNDLC